MSRAKFHKFLLQVTGDRAGRRTAEEPNDPGRQTIGVSGNIAPCLECSQSTSRLLLFRRTAQIFQECDGVFRDFRRTFVRSGSTLPNQTAWSI